MSLAACLFYICGLFFYFCGLGSFGNCDLNYFSGLDENKLISATCGNGNNVNTPDCLHFCVLTIRFYLDFFVLTVLIPFDVFVLSFPLHLLRFLRATSLVFFGCLCARLFRFLCANSLYFFEFLCSNCCATEMSI